MASRKLIVMGSGVYYRGLNNYLYFFGGSIIQLRHNGPQNPVRIIKAPIVDGFWLWCLTGVEFMVLGFRGLGLGDCSRVLSLGSSLWKLHIRRS